MLLKAHFHLRNNVEVPSRYMAVLNLASAINQDLTSDGKTPETLADAQLRHRISKELNGGRIELRTQFPVIGRYSFRKGMRDWFRRGKWWFILAVVSTSIMPFLMPAITLAIGAFLALTVARTKRSQTFFGVWGLIIFLPASAVYFSLIFGKSR